ncbi:MAG: S1 RNA-binding domain-containing protein [Acholeplasmatales bacterium]
MADEMKKLMDSVSVVKRGQKVTGEVFKIEEDVIFVTLDSNQEARMYKNHYGKPIETFIGEVKIGDKIDAVVSKVEETPEASFILLDRKNIVRLENLEKLEHAYRNEEVVEVRVSRVADKGLHIKVLGFDGFLPFGLLDKELIDKKDELKGKTLEAHIIEVKGGRRITASRKKLFLQKRAHEQAERQRLREEEFESIKTGDVLKGRVEKIEKHMALIRFNHVAGRLRISQIQYGRLDSISDVLEKGEEVEVKVIKKDRGLDLSMKDLLPTPFEVFQESHKKGDKVIGEIVQKLPFGIIVELQESIRGLLHKSEFSWNPNDNFQSHVKIGDKVETVITLIDPKKNKISLSRRLLLDNPWKDVNFKKGEVVEAKVLAVSENGLTVEAKGVEGFIPVGELRVERTDNPKDFFSEGDKVTAKVIDVNPKQWYLRLSIKQQLVDASRENYKQFLTEDIEKTTLGDLFDDVLTPVEEPKKKTKKATPKKEEAKEEVKKEKAPAKKEKKAEVKEEVKEE